MSINTKKFSTLVQNIKHSITTVSSETVGWVSVLILHAATIPSLLAVMKGYTDTMLPIDMVLLLWTALTLMFVKAAVQRDMLNLITIGLGFVVQASLMALIFFK
jgi:hypothetical protein